MLLISKHSENYKRSFVESLLLFGTFGINKTSGSFLCCLHSIPLTLAEWALGLLLTRPLVNAVSVVCMIAGSPGNSASITLADLAGLALETGFVDAVLADGAVLDGHIPAPKGHCVPLFDFNSLVNLHLNYYKQCLQNVINQGFPRTNFLWVWMAFVPISSQL